MNVDDEEKTIIHCSKANPSISCCSADSFFACYPVFCVVQHKCYETSGYNEGTVQMAKCLAKLPTTHLWNRYDLLKRNCECFAIACITRGLLVYSEQIQKVWFEMNNKLGKEQAVAIMVILSSFTSSSM